MTDVLDTRSEDIVSAPETTAETDVLLRQLRQLDASAHLLPRTGPLRFCTTPHCLCGYQIMFRGHVHGVGHAPLGDMDSAKAAAVCSRVVEQPCSCCKALRAAARRSEAKGVRVCFTCNKPGHLVRDCPESRCSYCGGRGHLERCRVQLHWFRQRLRREERPCARLRLQMIHR